MAWARLIPLVGELADVIKRRKDARQIEVNGTIQLSNLIFHRCGELITEFRKAWASASKRAGVLAYTRFFTIYADRP